MAIAALLALLAVGASQWTGLATPSAEAQQSAPGAPASVTVARGDDYLDVSWTALASDGGGAIAGYDIQVSGDSKASWRRAATGANPSPVNGTYTYRVAESVSDAATYYAAVRASNASDTSLMAERRAHLGQADPQRERARGGKLEFQRASGVAVNSYELRWTKAIAAPLRGVTAFRMAQRSATTNCAG